MDRMRARRHELLALAAWFLAVFSAALLLTS
jgi:hypothetical protein